MDYKSKYLKYKKKYLLLKGGNVIDLTNATWEDRNFEQGKGINSNNKITGKLKTANISKNFNGKNVELKDISGEWDYKLEDNHYDGTFKSEAGDEKKIDVIGKWDGSAHFYGLSGDTKKSNAIELKSLDTMDYNVSYRLKDFMKHSTFEGDSLLVDNNWEITKVNTDVFTTQELNKLKEKLKKNDPNITYIPDKELKDMIGDFILYTFFYNKGLGINININKIKNNMLTINNYFEQGGMFYKINNTVEQKFYIFNIKFKPIEITIHPNNIYIGDDYLLKKKSILLYDNTYIINNNNDILKYKLIKQYFIPPKSP